MALGGRRVKTNREILSPHPHPIALQNQIGFMLRKRRPSKPPVACQMDAGGSGVEIKGRHEMLASKTGPYRGGPPAPKGVEEWGAAGTPSKPKASSPSLDSFEEIWGAQRAQANWQRVFISSLLMLPSVSVPSLQLQPLPAPQVPGSSLLRSYITLLSEARRASSLLCLLVTTFPHSSRGMALLLGTANRTPGSPLPWP